MTLGRTPAATSIILCSGRGIAVVRNRLVEFCACARAGPRAVLAEDSDPIIQFSPEVVAWVQKGGDGFV